MHILYTHLISPPRGHSSTNTFQSHAPGIRWQSPLRGSFVGPSVGYLKKEMYRELMRDSEGWGPKSLSKMFLSDKNQSKVFVSLNSASWILLRYLRCIYLRYLRYLSFYSTNTKSLHPSSSFIPSNRPCTLDVSVRSRNSFHSSSCSYLQELTNAIKLVIPILTNNTDNNFPKPPWKMKQLQ